MGPVSCTEICVPFKPYPPELQCTQVKLSSFVNFNSKYWWFWDLDTSPPFCQSVPCDQLRPNQACLWSREQRWSEKDHLKLPFVIRTLGDHQYFWIIKVHIVIWNNFVTTTYLVHQRPHFHLKMLLDHHGLEGIFKIQTFDWNLLLLILKVTAKRTPSIVKGNKSLSLVWSKWRSQWWWIWKALQCVAISYWLNGFSANEEYWNISLTADVSLSLIGREKRCRVLS